MTEMLPEVAEAIRIADKYCPGSPPEYRAQLAKEIIAAISKFALVQAVAALDEVRAKAAS